MAGKSLVRSRRGGRFRWLQGTLTATPQDIANGLLAFMVFIEITALGVNDQLLQAYANILNIFIALVVLNWLKADLAFWKQIAYPFLALALGLTWACLPVFATTYDLWSVMPGAKPPRPVPDLQFSGGLRFVSQMAILMTATLVGYRRASMRALVDWILIFGLANLVLGLLLRWVDPQHVWGMAKTMHEFRFTGTFQNANVAGVLFGVLGLLALGELLALIEFGGIHHAAAARGWSTFYALCAFAFFGALLITASRSAIVLTILAGTALAIRPYIVRKMGIKGALIGFAIAAVMLAFVLFAASTLDLPVLARFSQVGPDSVYRSAIYGRFWQIYLHSPLFGYGLSSFSDVNLAFLETAREAREFGYINAAHNQLLQLLMAGGWPFLAAHVIAIAIIVRRSVSQGTLSGASALAPWLALLVVLGCSMIDIALTVPAILAFCVVIIGNMWGRGVRTRLDAIMLANKPKSYYSWKKAKLREQQADAGNGTTGDSAPFKQAVSRTN